MKFLKNLLREKRKRQIRKLEEKIRKIEKKIKKGDELAGLTLRMSYSITGDLTRMNELGEDLNCVWLPAREKLTKKLRWVNYKLRKYRKK